MTALDPRWNGDSRHECEIKCRSKQRSDAHAFFHVTPKGCSHIDKIVQWRGWRHMLRQRGRRRRERRHDHSPPTTITTACWWDVHQLGRQGRRRRRCGLRHSSPTVVAISLLAGTGPARSAEAKARASPQLPNHHHHSLLVGCAPAGPARAAKAETRAAVGEAVPRRLVAVGEAVPEPGRRRQPQA